ncbi:MAG: FAD-dependent oxidoreductase, partial [Acidobacteriota bacterium]|nr:FAD-dependent oxidoreductase [Acidobacteriota bacterium]
MKAVVVGNGVAGTIAAKSLREADPDIEIVLFGGERHPYYPRPNLIEFLAGRLPRENLFAFPASWYAARRIDLRLGRLILRIRPDERLVEPAGGGAEGYDVLCLADGASSAVPPIRGTDKPGVFTLRTLDDAEAILAGVAASPATVVIGGGLLGLEIARALKARGAAVTVLEFLPRLLPRQLDEAGAAILTRQIETGGIRVRTGVTVEEIPGAGRAAGVRLKTGEEIAAGTVIIAAGIRPNTALAREAGLTVDRGVVVDDLMATSRPGIFAAGDGTQHKGRLYGVIPASFEQARTAAASMLGLSRPYAGTVLSNTLKVMGLDLTSVGLVNPEPPGEAEELRREEPEAGLYRKIVLQGGRLVGAVWMGTNKGVPMLARAVAEKRDVAAF